MIKTSLIWRCRWEGIVWLGTGKTFQSSVPVCSRFFLSDGENRTFSVGGQVQRGKHLRLSLMFLVPCACTVCAPVQRAEWHCSDLSLLWVYLGKGKSLHRDWAIGSYGNQLWRNGELLQRAEICARELAADLRVACLVSLCCLLPLCLKLMGVVYIL